VSTWKQTGRRALRGALEARKRARVARTDPLCVYDVAEKLGPDVKFVAVNSFGGMYVRTSETILVPSLRPPGRQAYTCGHELGHWFFDHGTRVDDISTLDEEMWDDPDERLAHLFSGFLLAPPWTVKDAFKRRVWQPASCSPLQAYTIAVQLGMGYESLVNHLLRSLRLISSSQAKHLSSMTPKKIRSMVLGEDHPGHLVIADRAWRAVPVDLSVGDLAILPDNVGLEGRSVTLQGSLKKYGIIVEGRQPGITRAELKDGSWATFLRVCRKEFEGRNIYRHMEDPDVD